MLIEKTIKGLAGKAAKLAARMLIEFSARGMDADTHFVVNGYYADSDEVTRFYLTIDEALKLHSEIGLCLPEQTQREPHLGALNEHQINTALKGVQMSCETNYGGELCVYDNEGEHAFTLPKPCTMPQLIAELTEYTADLEYGMGMRKTAADIRKILGVKSNI